MEVYSVGNYFFISSVKDLKSKGINFSENEILTGKVIATFDNKIILNIKGENLLAETELKLLPQEELKLQVIKYTAEKIILKLLSKETQILEENLKSILFTLKNFSSLGEEFNKLFSLDDSKDIKNILISLDFEKFFNSLNTSFENKILNEKDIEGDVKFILFKILNLAKTSSEKNFVREIISNIQTQQFLNFLNYFNKTSLPLYYQIPLFYQDKFFTLQLKIYPEKTAKNKKISLENLKITILLNPPQLGFIKIDLFFQKEVLSFFITTEKEKTKRLLEENFEILKEKLKNLGYKNIRMKTRLDRALAEEDFLREFEVFSKRIDVVV